MARYYIGFVCLVTLLTLKSAFALEPLDAKTMKETTAKAGISIILDDIVLESWTGEIIFTDNDGNGDGKPASIVIGNSHSVMTINAITGASLKRTTP